MSDEGVFGLAEGLLDRLFVVRQGLLLLRLRELEVRAVSAAAEDRQRHGRSELPGASGPREKIRERDALDPIGPGEEDLRKERRLGDSDLGVGSDQDLFRLAD